ncbi:hypothetical protein OS493_040397, partial [Desmophyllum pertusum]
MMNATHRYFTPQYMVVLGQLILCCTTEGIFMPLTKIEWREILSNKKSEGVSPMRRLIERFPQVAKLVLDKCIEHSPHLDTDPNYS